MKSTRLGENPRKSCKINRNRNEIDKKKQRIKVAQRVL